MLVESRIGTPSQDSNPCIEVLPKNPSREIAWFIGVAATIFSISAIVMTGAFLGGPSVVDSVAMLAGGVFALAVGIMFIRAYSHRVMGEFPLRLEGTRLVCYATVRDYLHDKPRGIAEMDVQLLFLAYDETGVMDGIAIELKEGRPVFLGARPAKELAAISAGLVSVWPGVRVERESRSPTAPGP